MFGTIKCGDHRIWSIDKYSFQTNNWYSAGRILNFHLEDFCVSAFMDNIYVMGGSVSYDNVNIEIGTPDCFAFATVNNILYEVHEMNEARLYAASAVFEGNVVVAGGCDLSEGELKSVEKYDHVAGTWSTMPDMIRERASHSLVPVGSKLFVVGGSFDSCEVFDSRTNKFVLMNSASELKFNFERAAGAVSMGNKMVVFYSDLSLVGYYDVDKGQWSEVSHEGEKFGRLNGCSKMPQL